MTSPLAIPLTSPPARIDFHKIRVTNPSPDQARGGNVEVRVGRASVPRLRQPFAIKDKEGTELLAQYDVIDPDDRARDTLVVRLAKPIPAGESATLQIHSTAPGSTHVPGVGDPRVHVQTSKRGVKLINHELDVFFSLVPDHLPGTSVYGGAATSVVLTDFSNSYPFPFPPRIEVLDAFNQQVYGHDAEKRCMQIDQLQLYHPATDPVPLQTVHMAHRKYEVVAENTGALRACVTIASDPFEYVYWDPLAAKDADPVTLTCRLHRVLSVYRDDAIIDRVYVRGTHGSHSTDLYFTARYFAYLDLGRDYCGPIHYREIPDWLALGCAWRPKQGYGFCTDVHATPVQWPHPEFRGACADRTFSWSVDYSAEATCLHMFKIGVDVSLLAHETGRAWYFRIFQPLQAEFVA
jgi:hypothetical protein